eukprot:CAMPEP_0198357752 /NCGR_PEP_ID=MMETSP1450-20131203/128149_1 /TAXON_ID=753684 ORGANISM="Madagascaria erythrocladiodes, Strain CCMP3234" /NCGR_SAMPLE_ID=MMETSP1450 /ASSEMBLY_ACC=CAM_ASM_001115 /LENGTH=67 /DNA_ID=CAMNT_0044064421 /DNA_START=166 /DNA_END=369 /DNA_ORIENTATION=-
MAHMTACDLDPPDDGCKIVSDLLDDLPVVAPRHPGPISRSLPSRTERSADVDRPNRSCGSQASSPPS